LATAGNVSTLVNPKSPTALKMLLAPKRVAPSPKKAKKATRKPSFWTGRGIKDRLGTIDKSARSGSVVGGNGGNGGAAKRRRTSSSSSQCSGGSAVGGTGGGGGRDNGCGDGDGDAGGHSAGVEAAAAERFEVVADHAEVDSAQGDWDALVAEPAPAVPAPEEMTHLKEFSVGRVLALIDGGSDLLGAALAEKVAALADVAGGSGVPGLSRSVGAGASASGYVQADTIVGATDEDEGVSVPDSDEHAGGLFERSIQLYNTRFVMQQRRGKGSYILRPSDIGSVLVEREIQG
jgi:hypothetical protein